MSSVVTPAPLLVVSDIAPLDELAGSSVVLVPVASLVVVVVVAGGGLGSMADVSNDPGLQPQPDHRP